MNLDFHLEAIGEFFRQAGKQPVGTLLTLSVLAVALALPAALHTVLANAGALLANWETQTQVSLYLRDGIAEEDVQDLQGRLAINAEVTSVRFISKEEAVEEFRKMSGMEAALEGLDENPLPASLVVGLDPTLRPLQIENLVKAWRQEPPVEDARFDLEWVQRWQAILALLRDFVFYLTMLLAAAVILIIGNTIRLSIVNRRDEIATARLLGASDSFILFPFLYQGTIQGMIAGATSWGIVSFGVYVLQAPTQRIAALYDSTFILASLPWSEGFILILGGGALGFSGALLAVARHMNISAKG